MSPIEVLQNLSEYQLSIGAAQHRQFCLQPEVEMNVKVELAEGAFTQFFLPFGVHLEKVVLNMHLAPGSKAYLVGFGPGADSIQTELNFHLGENAKLELGLGIVGRGEKTHSARTNVVHQSPHSTSSQIIRQILFDRSTSEFHGRIEVYKDALGADANQSAKSWLQSNQATVRNRPELRIFADDVKAKHGATVGGLDEEAVFYLQSRGWKMETAKRKLFEGFLREIYAHWPSGGFKDFVSRSFNEIFRDGEVVH